MAEIGSTRTQAHAHFIRYAWCLVMALPLFAVGTILSLPQTFAEGTQSSGASLTDHFEPCKFLISTPSGPASESQSDPRLRIHPYWSLVRSRITGFWTAPPVDAKALTVIVRFRLERDGSVSNLAIEKSSGNAYFDMAAQNAVRSAVPLPRVPPDLTEPYYDTTFTFSSGEAAGALNVPQKVFVGYQQLTDTGLHLSRRNTGREVNTSSEKDPREDCRIHLDNINNAIRQAPENEEGLKTLQRLSSQLPPVKSLDRNSDGDLADSVERWHDDIKNRTEEISNKIAFAIKFRQFDKLCEGKMAKAGMPARFRDEPIYLGFSGRPESRTLGRAFCTAINGGGKVQFHVLDEKPPTVSISVTTKKRRFAVVFQKKMQADLSEAWRAVEIQTPSDRRPAYEMLGQTFMDGLPELVQNE